MNGIGKKKNDSLPFISLEFILAFPSSRFVPLNREENNQRKKEGRKKKKRKTEMKREK